MWGWGKYCKHLLSVYGTCSSEQGTFDEGEIEVIEALVILVMTILGTFIGGKLLKRF